MASFNTSPKGEVQLVTRLARSLISDMVSRQFASLCNQIATISGRNTRDRIHVIEEGRVLESGSHKDLIARGGRYAAWWSAQNLE
jgi:ABC-type multidrug transport system fused ATPase/permease subunit